MSITIEQIAAPEVTTTPKAQIRLKTSRLFGTKSQPCTPVTKTTKNIKEGCKGGFMKLGCKVPESNILRPAPVKIQKKWSFEDLSSVTKMMDVVELLDNNEEPLKKIAPTPNCV